VKLRTQDLKYGRNTMRTNVFKNKDRWKYNKTSVRDMQRKQGGMQE
jgi:hypothetical protein